MSVLMRGMKLEPIIQSKVSQKEKYQCCILHIYNDTAIKNRFLDSVGEGEGGMI